ncbi:unnamed protein product [Paramecium octaurelia]|uniref:Uncharacterized protein n=1 Tax=Paramecium octaurelia TaxID=43137 RepID=A0A8S1S3B8_PAROT|nr:unnamed protein product [Paramecium octaurelia]
MKFDCDFTMGKQVLKQFTHLVKSKCKQVDLISITYFILKYVMLFQTSYHYMVLVLQQLFFQIKLK